MTIAALLLAAALSSNTGKVLAEYDAHHAKRLVPMVAELVRFPTFVGETEAHAKQKAWLLRNAARMGFVGRDAGKITEIELPGAEGAPVLGLVIHGDVQKAEAAAWSFPPFAGRVENGYVLGRGAADDKGPLAQALLAMHALKKSGVTRTHTVRLLVGSEEESDATEIAEYLKTHAPPDYSLVLDSEFPVVVGEKAWDGLALVTSPGERQGVTKPWSVEAISAGLGPSIVPDRAEVTLRWRDGNAQWAGLMKTLRGIALPEGTRLEMIPEGETLRIVARGRSAHSGVNLTGGRNALVALARAMEGQLPSGGADDLLAFARIAGRDLHGTGLGIHDEDPIWGRYGVNVATIAPLVADPSKTVLYINLRRIPPRTAPEMRAHLAAFLAKFNEETGAALTIDDATSWFRDEPLGFDPNGRLPRRLMDIYERATGEKAKPAISGGGTYAKRLPNSIAFGMWFPGKPYPGHDVDEKISVADLERGARVLIHALTEIATGEPITDPFKP